MCLVGGLSVGPVGGLLVALVIGLLVGCHGSCH